MEHKQTNSYYHSLKSIVNGFAFKSSGLRFLEIGTGWGISARIFLEHQNVGQVVSVDKNELKPEAKEIIDEVANGRFQQIVKDSDRYFSEDKPWDQFDFVFIDGDHRYFQVVKDLENGWKTLKKDGLMVMHDVLHRGNFDGDQSDYGVAHAALDFLWQKDLTKPASIWPIYPGIIYFQKE